MKKNRLILLLSANLIILVAILLFNISSGLTGKTIESSNANIIYSYTKAICDSNNVCKDYEITCNGKNLVNMTDAKGYAVKFSENWEDPRNQTGELC